MSAKILKYSISPAGIPIVSFELEYPRFILAELNTHCMLSKNTASSRAIPIESVIDLVESTPAIPVYWGKKNKGMSAIEEINDIEKAKEIWLRGRDLAVSIAKELNGIELHKQITNRVLEPWVICKSVLTGTELANFFWLRYHSAAQPEIRLLAKEMYDALKAATPECLKLGEWHLPYVKAYRQEDGNLHYYDEDNNEIPLDQARKLSASCCAQASYRKLNKSTDKAEDIFSRLIDTGGDPVHASPVEHQATPIDFTAHKVQPGVTHMDRNSMLWSAKFKGWIQYRKLIPNESVPGFYIDIEG